MAHFVFSLLLLLVLLIPGSAVSQLVNGGFETGDLTGWTRYHAVSCKNGSSSIRIQVRNEPCDVWVPTVGPCFIEGTYHARLQAGQNEVGARDGLYQIVSNLVAGGSYRLEMQGLIRSSQAGLDTLRLWWLPRALSEIIPSPPSACNPANFPADAVLVAEWTQSVGTPGNQWTLLGGTVTTPSGTGTILVDVVFDDPNMLYSIACAYLDAVSLAYMGPSPTLSPTRTPGGPSETPTRTPTYTQTPGDNPTPFVPTGPVWGLVPVIGERFDVPGYRHDDLGPPLERVAQVVADSAATSLPIGFAEWSYMEPNDPGNGPSTYDWRLLDAAVEPFVPLLPGRLGVTYASFNHPAWLDAQYDTPRYWMLAERFLEAFARRMNRIGVYHFSFENEPNLLARPDWADYYMNRLRHAYAAIKRADARNQIIAGNLSERAAENGQMDMLYDRGLASYCDVVGYHPYSDNPATGVNIDDVIALRQRMVARGDGHKKMFLSEGWGPKRELSGWPRKIAAERPSRVEINQLRDFMINGYQRLANPRPGYDPQWLLGAWFFTLNDNLCCRHWAARATPVPGGCLIDGYYIGGCDLTPGHFNGGLIDLYGNAKSDIIWRFPDGAFRASPTPVPNPPAIGPNLLINGNFEGGFTNGTANGWQRFDTTRTGEWMARPGRNGGLAQAFGENDIGFSGGVAQTFDTVPGRWYGISLWIAYELNNANNPGRQMSVVWDPTGQLRDPRELTATVSINYADLGWAAGQWQRVEHLFQATGPRASLWFWCSQEWAAPVFFMWVDDAEVREVENPRATPTPANEGYLSVY